MTRANTVIASEAKQSSLSISPWIATAFGLATTRADAVIASAAKQSSLSISPWIATASGLAMTRANAVIASAAKQSSLSISPWIATASGLAMTRANAVIASAAKQSSLSSSPWIATGLRPRDDEGQHRHCERSEAIHASPWITNFTASYLMPKMGTINPNMGFIERVEMNQETGLGDALFSTTQQRVLGYLFGQPERTFFANELIALTGGGSGAVQRELKRLETSGLLKTERRGNQKHYQANENSPIYAELCGIVQKTFGLAGPLKNALTSFAEQIQAAFIFGSVAKNRDTASSDIDLMVISDSLAYADLYTRLTEVEQQLGRQINPTIYTREELLRRINDDNAFVSRVLNQAKIWLIGNEHAITP